MCLNCHNYYLNCRGHKKGCKSFKPYDELAYRKHYEKETGIKLAKQLLKNLRKEKRYTVKDNIGKTLKYYDINNKIWKQGTLINISKNGIGFKSNSDLSNYVTEQYIPVSINFTNRIKTIMVIQIKHINNNICGGIIVKKKCAIGEK